VRFLKGLVNQSAGGVAPWPSGSAASGVVSSIEAWGSNEAGAVQDVAVPVAGEQHHVDRPDLGRRHSRTGGLISARSPLGLGPGGVERQVGQQL